jgi:quercetin dioxygenase-like cupin family protein
MIQAVLPCFVVTYEGTTLNTYHANKGQGLPAHDHIYSHLTQCHAGSCIVRKENVERIITKRDKPLNLAANEWHEIEALEDGTVFVNVFAEGKV